MSPLPLGMVKLINFFFMLFKSKFNTDKTEIQAKILFTKLLVEYAVSK